MAGEIFQIYSVQVIGKCICEFFLPSFDDLIINPHVKQPLPQVYAKKFVPHPGKVFLRKRSLHTFEGEEILCFIFISFPISKVSSLTFVIQTMDYLSTVFLKS